VQDVERDPPSLPVCKTLPCVVLAEILELDGDILTGFATRRVEHMAGDRTTSSHGVMTSSEGESSKEWRWRCVMSRGEKKEGRRRGESQKTISQTARIF